MKRQQPGAFTQLLTRQHWTVLSILIVLAMYGLAAFIQEADSVARARQAQKAAQAEASLDLGGAFSLVDQEGQTVTQEIFQGVYTVFVFDAAASVLPQLADVYTSFSDSQRQQLQLLYVQERDSADLKDDFPQVSPDFWAELSLLSGDDAALAQVKQLYNVREGEGPFVYLMSPTGTFLARYSLSGRLDALQKDLQDLLG